MEKVLTDLGVANTSRMEGLARSMLSPDQRTDAKLLFRDICSAVTGEASRNDGDVESTLFQDRLVGEANLKTILACKSAIVRITFLHSFESRRHP